jgi:hypothetical protein
MAGQENEVMAKRVHHFPFRCPGELYGFAWEPDARDNRVDVPGCACRLQEFRQDTPKWMRDTADGLVKDFAVILPL